MSLELKNERPGACLLDSAGEAMAGCRELLVDVRQVREEGGDQVHSLRASERLPLRVRALADDVVDGNQAALLQVRHVASRPCNHKRRVVVPLLAHQVVVHVVLDHLLDSASALDLCATWCRNQASQNQQQQHHAGDTLHSPHLGCLPVGPGPLLLARHNMRSPIMVPAILYLMALTPQTSPMLFSSGYVIGFVVLGRPKGAH